MDSEVINELDDLFWRLDTIVRRAPEYIRKLKPKWRALEQTATNTARVEKLRRYWSDVPQSVMLELTTQQSVPFVTVMLGLAERKYKVSQFSMVNWWRRMCSTGQEKILTYFSRKRFAETFFGQTVVASDLLRVCTDNQAFLDNIAEALADDRSVDFKIRELLGGISMQSDVTAAWKKWCMTNHPDKGGDAEHFLEVKLVYDEWMDINKRTTTQQGANNE